MATLECAQQLLPEQLRDSLIGAGNSMVEFLMSGVLQVERVVKGPRPRSEVVHGYRSRMLHSDPMLRNDLTVSEDTSDSEPYLLSENSSIRRAKQLTDQHLMTSFVLAALPTPTSTYADVQTSRVPAHILSDAVRHSFAGTAARTMSQAIVHPLDTVKTRMQVNKATAPLLLQLWRKDSKEKSLQLFLGGHRILQLRNWLVRGPVDLYKGLTGAVLGTVPVAMVYFATYEACKGFMKRNGASDAMSHLASASTGAILSAFIRVPTDTLKHRTQAYITPDVFTGATNLVSSNGLAGLYKGLFPTLLRDVPELAVQFSLYEAFRIALERHRQVKKLKTSEHLLLGGLSGGIAASLTMPLDVAKTAMQCGGGNNIAQVLKDTVRDKGTAGLYSGMGPRVSLIALQGAVFFTLFEAWKAQLKPEEHRDGSDKYVGPKLWRKKRGHIWKRQFVLQ